MDVFLATATTLSDPDDDDEILRAALAAAGIKARNVAWDDPAADWTAARACVMRSTWNYVHHYAEFLEWAERCTAATRLLNPLPVVRWNSHKRYLIELAERGLPVVATRLIPKGSTAHLATIAPTWRDVVVKPAVGAGSYATMRVAPEDMARGQAHLETLAQVGDVLVQPYVKSVEASGERALVWIDGAFTHAVRKSPRFAEDIERVSDALPIADDELAVAEAVFAGALEAIRQAAGLDVPPSLLYARVDLARDEDGRPRLMELELIEPSLFLKQSPAALTRFVDAIGRVARG